MTTEWPNKLGYDVDSAEVWRHPDKFRVFTETKTMLVPYSVTTNPETAVTICNELGLTHDELDNVEPWEAQAMFVANLPTQKELF